ncbi:DNA alkylation repair protein [Vallitalea pronyensis]|uniref:DNA alkylation repair protein n=1 Tax=Vallitalea pronyensis TaxID=1348613 RepID=A0A8J8SGI0_9FIRM|nr:DNA alkylation repair protein [Vallitalea pronyensis]QUI22377.1 DNA alkylation repair protein [Vallitalea pronyensis]
MKIHEVMTELELMGTEQTRKIYRNHGCKGPLFGVKIGDLKKLVKKIKKDHELGLELFKTGNYDAMYLAHYIVEPKKMTKALLDEWLFATTGYMINEYAVSNVAAESSVALPCIHDWIKAEGEDNGYKRAAAYSTYANYISVTPNEQLDMDEIRQLINHIKENIHDEENRVRYTMNNFVISVGAYIPTLSEEAIAIAEEIGKVNVYMGKTSCKVPVASESIMKIKDMGRLGKKRKKVIC